MFRLTPNAAIEDPLNGKGAAEEVGTSSNATHAIAIRCPRVRPIHVVGGRTIDPEVRRYRDMIEVEGTFRSTRSCIPSLGITHLLCRPRQDTPTAEPLRNHSAALSTFHCLYSSCLSNTGTCLLPRKFECELAHSSAVSPYSCPVGEEGRSLGNASSRTGNDP